MECGDREIPSLDKSYCVMSILCQEDEFVKGEVCVACNNLNSFLYVVATMLSFVAATYAVNQLASIRHQMIRIKVLSTFYQAAQLTTMIKIEWPAIALMTLPFSLPFSDSKCLAAGSGWNQTYTFYAFIYGPLVAFALIFRSYNKASIGTRVKFEQMVTILLILWYSPVIQVCASMFECFDDKERGWSLVADPSVSCKASTSRTFVVAHMCIICTVVGAGFPAYIFYKTRKLREEKKLTAGLPLTSLFEWYTPKVPYFEAYHMIRKALLILVTTVFPTSVMQAIWSFVVNVLFFLVLYRKEPMIHYPSSFFKGRSLFTLAELLSAATSLVGNILAIIGALADDSKSVNFVGLVFAVVNISFGVLLFFGYAMDTRKRRSTVAPELRADGEIEGSRSQSMIKAVSANVQRIEMEWNTQCAFIAASEEGSKEKTQMKKEIGLVRSKLEQEIRADLSKTEEEMKALDREIVEVKNEIIECENEGIDYKEDAEKLTAAEEKKEKMEKTYTRVFGEYTELLNRLERDMKELFRDDAVNVLPALTIESMAIQDNLTIIATLSKQSMEFSSLALARGLEEGGK